MVLIEKEKIIVNGIFWIYTNLKWFLTCYCRVGVREALLNSCKFTEVGKLVSHT